MSIADIRTEFQKFCDSRELKDFCHTVSVVHEDGSSMILKHASVWRSNCTRWVGVSTEHCGNLFFCIDDLHSWGVYAPANR